MHPLVGTETTKIYYGVDNAMKILLQATANVKKEAIVCSDTNFPGLSIGLESIKKEYVNFRDMGIRIRQIMEIKR